MIATWALGLLFAGFAFLAVRGDIHRAAILLSLALAVAILGSEGHDIYDHAARIHELRSGLAEGRPDLFIEAEGRALPVFYFYSPGFYMLAMLPVLAGLGAAKSAQLTAALFFLVMAGSAYRLFLDLAGKDAPDRHHRAGMALILLVSANYTILNFAARNAYPEAASYALVPAVILALRGRHTVLAIALLCLQIALHPPVFPQAAVAGLGAHLILTRRPFLLEAARSLLLTGIAVALAFPIWAAALWEADLIMGAEALPVPFEATFLKPLALLDPGDFRTTGPVLLLVLAATVGLGFRTQRRSMVFAALALIVLAVQTVPLRPLMVHVPLADLGLFIWRWMFVTVWFAVLAIATGLPVPPRAWAARAALVLAGLNAGLLAVASIGPPTPDAVFARYIALADQTEDRWGFAEYYPRYDDLPMACDALVGTGARELRFSELRAAPVDATGPLVIPHAPLAGLTYRADGDPAALAVCGTRLILRHPAPGTPVRFDVTGDILIRNPGIRLFWPVLALAFALAAGALAWAGRGRHRDATP